MLVREKISLIFTTTFTGAIFPRGDYRKHCAEGGSGAQLAYGARRPDAISAIRFDWHAGALSSSLSAC